MTHPANTLSLVADIGGTNTRIALADGIAILPKTIRRYANADYPDLRSVLSTYIDQENGVDTRAACIAVAGPVHGDSAKMTNLDWSITHKDIAAATRAETVAILNDLQAQGYALGHLARENVTSVLAGDTVTGPETQLVVGIGTGFNAAPVFETPHGRFVAPSESGHVDLPVRTPAELDLALRFADHKGHPSVEDALSGRGLVNIYRAIDASAPMLTGREILDAAREDGSQASRAVEIFVTTAGKVCGNLALTQLPFGGINLVGGMTRAILPFLDTHGFAHGFTSKGRFESFMSRFSVNVIEDDYAALIGCAAFLTDHPR